MLSEKVDEGNIWFSVDEWIWIIADASDTNIFKLF